MENLDTAMLTLRSLNLIDEDKADTIRGVLTGFFLASASGSSGGAGAGAAPKKKKSSSGLPKLATMVKEIKTGILIPLIADPEGKADVVSFRFMAKCNGRPLTASNDTAFGAGTDAPFRIPVGMYTYETLKELYCAWSTAEKNHDWKIFAPIVRCMTKWSGPKSTLQSAIDGAGQLAVIDPAEIIVEVDDDDE